jgi:hypothetical protein
MWKSTSLAPVCATRKSIRSAMCPPVTRVFATATKKLLLALPNRPWWRNWLQPDKRFCLESLICCHSCHHNHGSVFLLGSGGWV